MAEEPLEHRHKSGITITGTLDRLEKTSDGLYIVADFNKGSSKGYKKGDFESCVQVLLYAYMLSQKGYDISCGEYRFLSEELVISILIRTAADTVLTKRSATRRR